MSGVRRAPGVAVAAVMPWMVIAAAALTKTPPPLPSRVLFALERELVGAEGPLPRGPRFVIAGEAVPVRAFFGEAPRDEERAGGNRGKPHVVDGELLLDQLLLRVLDTVNLLGYAQVVSPPAEHG